MIRALVSIGTNSTRLLVLDGECRVAAESRGTRIGSGIGATGSIDPAARERTLSAIGEYVAIARAAGARAIDAVATSALRRATDGEAFGRAVAQLAGIEPRVLSGEEEATYAFLGATVASAGAHSVAVLDVGGGSTELAVDVPSRARATGVVRFTSSTEIGAVRLSERYPSLLGAQPLAPHARAALEGEARADVAGALAAYADVRGFDSLIAVGGTVFTAGAMLAGGVADGTEMSHADRVRLIDTLLERDLDRRKAIPHIRPQRADILPAGLIVVDEACRLLGVDRFTISESDVLRGYLDSPAYRPTALSDGR